MRRVGSWAPTCEASPTPVGWLKGLLALCLRCPPQPQDRVLASHMDQLALGRHPALSTPDTGLARVRRQETEITMSEETFWSNRRVLVTGGGGFLGAWIAKLCLDEGAQVHVAEHMASPSDLPQAVRCLVAHGIDRAVDVISLDITDSPKTATIFINEGIEVIFHMAAMSHINQSDRAPYEAFYLNVLGTLSVLEAARQNSRTLSVVVASSNHVYGSNKEARRES